ncbi:MAG: DUF1223 domain-containing protein [Brevundimonas sp.]
MKGISSLVMAGAAAVVMIGAASSGAQPAAAGSGARAALPVEPVVVELFTAQGCAGCPEANALVETLSQRPGIIALTYAVDYWDYLGWPDTFAQPAFAERQRAYQTRLRLRDVYTPQVIIDGARHLPGARTADIETAVEEEAARRIFMPEVEFREAGDRVGVGSGRAPEGGAEVWLIRYRSTPQVVQVAQGENRGLEVRHANVVREVTRLGEWRGRPILLTLPDPSEADLGAAVLVQALDDGRILAAADRPAPAL